MENKVTEREKVKEQNYNDCPHVYGITSHHESNHIIKQQLAKT